jgi:hypothetical protein
MAGRQDISPKWQERDTSKAGERPERIYFGLDEICSAFY